MSTNINIKDDGEFIVLTFTSIPISNGGEFSIELTHGEACSLSDSIIDVVRRSSSPPPLPKEGE
ncbi:MAG: hypothetical protein ACYS7Y_34215 [Planctomycetota bacterium]|jgi:hypothetical protein